MDCFENVEEEIISAVRVLEVNSDKHALEGRIFTMMGQLHEDPFVPSSSSYSISVMELGHLLTRSGLTYPEVSSKVCHDSFCQLETCVSLPWVICYEAFYLHVVSSFSCIPVICPKISL